MARGTVVLKSEGESRNKHQSVTLLEAIEEFGFDACIGGARRDEEKARAKERVFSFRDSFGQWDPKNQRPELWNLYNARVHQGENIRAFPISNWTELDVWQYIEREGLALPSIYFAHRRRVVRKNGLLQPVTPLTPAKEGDVVEEVSVRFRTVGDITCTAPVESTADSVAKIIEETAVSTVTERGATRLDDQTNDASWAAQEGRVLLMTARDHRARRSRRAAFLTAGSVDDGKSTLIGRLLYDTKAILADQLAAIERTSQRRGQALDLSLLTDGLVAEREQGITIDVAYRYFATATRKYIIADAPGHEQYTRNTVTAAST
jgi:3'-phosphoadenosine 5'-phosphosulfate sulfotransferase (PAPS reductase)/FAD synthetase